MLKAPLMWTADAPGAESTGHYALKWPWDSGRLRGSLLVPTNAPEATETVIRLNDRAKFTLRTEFLIFKLRHEPMLVKVAIERIRN